MRNNSDEKIVLRPGGGAWGLLALALIAATIYAPTNWRHNYTRSFPL